MSLQHSESEWEEMHGAAEDALETGDYAIAADRYECALELAERLELGDGFVADSLEGLAAARSLAGESAEVGPIDQRASDTRDRLLAEEEASLLPDQAAIAKCLDQCASHRLMQGKKSEAILLYERALEVRKSVFGELHFDVANSIAALASAHSHRDHNNSRTVELWQDAVDILERLFGEPETRTHEVASSLTGNLENLAMRAFAQDDFDTAETFFRRVVQVNSEFLGGESCVQPINAPAFARVLMHRSEFDEAETILKAADSEPILADERRRTLIELYEAAGRNEEAESLKREFQ